MKRTIIASLLVTFCLFCLATAGYSQGTNLGTIRGTVTDPNGAVVQGAAVQVTDQETGLSRDFTTDSQGNYEAAALKPGNYRVTVTASGFSTTAVDGVVTGGNVLRADVKVEVGGASGSVTVSGAEAGVIEKEQPVIAGTLTNRQLIEVPRDSRDIYEFLYLNPDITQGPGGDGTFKFIGGQSYGASFSLDSQRTNGGIFGEPTASQPSLETIGELTVLSKNFTAEYSGIANIRIETKRGGQDYHGSLFYNNKNSALAAYRVQDKNAAATFLPTADSPSFPLPQFNLNEAGGYLSGPLPLTRKNTFFLLSYERRWDLSPAQLRSSNIPTSRILGGDFSAIRNSSKPSVTGQIRALLTPAEFADPHFVIDLNNDPTDPDYRLVRIPERLLNPIALNILGYYPRTNPATPFRTNNGRLLDFVRNIPGLSTRDLSTLRIDHDFSAKDKFFAVYNFQVQSGDQKALAVSPLPAFGLRSFHQKNHTLSLSYTRVFSNTVVNEARGGLNYQYLFRRGNQTVRDFLSGIGFNEDEISSYAGIIGGEDLLDTAGQVAFTFAPFGGIPNGGRSINRNLNQKLVTFGDTLSWIVGQHSIRAGADFVKNQAVDGFSANRGQPRGLVNYGTTFTSFARFLIGLPPTSVTFVGNTRRGDLDVSNWENGFFVQDDWKVSKDVTFNLGLRYEYITPFVEKDDLMVNFDPTTSVNPGFQGRFIVPSERTLELLDPRFIAYGVVTADEAGVGRGLVKTDKNNFAPRVGVAWRLTDKNVLRAGFGIYYPTSAAQGMRDALATNAFNQSVQKRNTRGLPGGINPRGITPFTGGTVTVGDPTDFTALAANAIPFDLQSPRITQFNVTFERELWWDTGIRFSYVGTRQHGLIAGRDLNELAPNDTPFGILDENGDFCHPIDEDCIISPVDAARRPFPRLGDFLATYGNTGKGRSNALQIEVNRRFARGLTFNASYTLLDQKSNGIDSGNSTLGGTLYDQFTPQTDFSTDSFVSRHRFVTYGSYELPYGRGREFGKTASGLVDAVAGGWDLTWQMFAKSGTGFTPFWQCVNCADLGFFGPGNVGSGFIDAIGDFNQSNTYRPLVVGDPYGGLTGDQFFNPNAFALPPLGSDLFSNPAVAKRNFLRGPGTWGVNLGIRKYFNFSETSRLEVGADFNNVFNHPLYSPLDTSFAFLGEFNVDLDPVTHSLVIGDVTPNENFGRNNISYSQEGIDNRRSVRLRLRFTF